MAKIASLAAANNFLTVFGGTRLLSINGHSSNGAATVALYNGKVNADIVSANLVHTFLLGTAGYVNLDFVEGLDFGAGLIIVVTANAATFNLLAEYTAASPEA